jgi:hypothetical protein
MFLTNIEICLSMFNNKLKLLDTLIKFMYDRNEKIIKKYFFYQMRYSRFLLIQYSCCQKNNIGLTENWIKQ